MAGKKRTAASLRRDERAEKLKEQVREMNPEWFNGDETLFERSLAARLLSELMEDEFIGEMKTKIIIASPMKDKPQPAMIAEMVRSNAELGDKLLPAGA